MKKPSILYYETQDFQEPSLDYLKANFNLITLPDPSHDTADILNEAHALFAPMGFVCDKTKIDKCGQLCVIGSPTTGIPHIDENYADLKNIKICSLRDQQSFLAEITPTAELAFGMLIALTRHLPAAFNQVCRGQWDGKYFGTKTPKMMSQMSLGIVGLGRLGTLVAKYGKTFKMKVRYYDPYVECNEYIRCSNLIGLARQSDVISIHVHGTPENEKIINQKFIEEMPRGSVLINTARGNILDEIALLAALESGHLGGAALDTIDGEHLPGFRENLPEHPLLKYANHHDNLLLTPHYGGCTSDAWELTEKHIIDMMINELHERNLM